ncbi:MAG: hypothetical protein WBM42_16905 [Eudoraea sp.]
MLIIDSIFPEGWYNNIWANTAKEVQNGKKFLIGTQRELELTAIIKRLS